MGEGVRGMPKLPIAISLTAMLLISICLGWEDYSTTLAGYILMPTIKLNSWVIPIAALLPQVGQIAFMYAFAIDTNGRWKLIVAFCFYIISVGTDTYYKAHLSSNILVWIIAFAESNFLFTLGSEVAMTLCIGLLPIVLPGAIHELGEMLSAIHEELNRGSNQGAPAVQHEASIQRESRH